MRKLVGLSGDIFSFKIGISIQRPGNYECGNRTSDATVLLSHGEKFGVNLNYWLLTCEDEMFIYMMKTQAFNISPPAIPTGLPKKLGRIA